MKILSIDTSSDICGVSILENTNLIKNIDTCTGRTHSENLLPIIKEILKDTNISLSEIDLLVCDKGPGSFTGIRIGISTVKAFSDSLSTPSIGISSLKALAYNIKKDDIIASIIDCKNNNCYFALYEKNNNEYIELIEPMSDTINNILNFCKDFIENTSENNSIIFVGDGAKIYEETILSNFPNAILSNEKQNTLNSYSLGLAGFYEYKNILEKGLNLSDNTVLPLYLKKPQAQRQLEEKLKNINT